MQLSCTASRASLSKRHQLIVRQASIEQVAKAAWFKSFADNDRGRRRIRRVVSVRCRQTRGAPSSQVRPQRRHRSLQAFAPNYRRAEFEMPVSHACEVLTARMRCKLTYRYAQRALEPYSALGEA